MQNHRDLIDAEFCINPDGGSANLRNGRRTYMGFQAAEKIYASFKLEVDGPGGHSSLPTKDNTIYTLSEGLSRLANLEFPVHLFDVTRASFERRASLYDGQIAADLKAVTMNPNDAAAVARLIGNSGLQRPDANHLHTHDDVRRARRKRPAPGGERNRQLPYPAGR